MVALVRKGGKVYAVWLQSLASHTPHIPKTPVTEIRNPISDQDRASSYLRFSFFKRVLEMEFWSILFYREALLEPETRAVPEGLDVKPPTAIAAHV